MEFNKKYSLNICNMQNMHNPVTVTIPYKQSDNIWDWLCKAVQIAQTEKQNLDTLSHKK